MPSKTPIWVSCSLYTQYAGHQGFIENSESVCSKNPYNVINNAYDMDISCKKIEKNAYKIFCFQSIEDSFLKFRISK